MRGCKIQRATVELKQAEKSTFGGHFVTLQYASPPSTADKVGTSIPEYLLRSQGFLLDTNIVIELLSRRTVLPDSLSIAVSVITIVELSKSKLITTSQIDDFLQDCLHADISDVDVVTAHHARILRSYTSLKVPDALIAAAAITENLTLVTEDRQLLRTLNIDVVNHETFMRKIEKHNEQ